MPIQLRFIGKTQDDLRFFIRKDEQHAGGITVHSVSGDSFSYGIAVAPPLRRQGIAKASLPLLFDAMRRRGFSRVFVEIRRDNAASLALHAALGFHKAHESDGVIRMERAL